MLPTDGFPSETTALVHFRGFASVSNPERKRLAPGGGNRGMGVAVSGGFRGTADEVFTFWNSILYWKLTYIGKWNEHKSWHMPISIGFRSWSANFPRDRFAYLNIHRIGYGQSPYLYGYADYFPRPDLPTVGRKEKNKQRTLSVPNEPRDSSTRTTRKKITRHEKR